MPKTIKLVTLIIQESRLYEEQEGVLLFRSTGRKHFVMFPKKIMYNFEKVITWFPHWREGRMKIKSLKFDIPLWLFDKKKYEIESLHDYVIITNDHL